MKVATPPSQPRCATAQPCPVRITLRRLAAPRVEPPRVEHAPPARWRRLHREAR